MSQKIIIPKGTIDSAHTTIIEIPNYLHETSTVVVTTPKTADSAIEQSWQANEYEESAEQNETDWEQGYEGQETNEDADYCSDQQDQFAGYQFDAPSHDIENASETQQQPGDQGRAYGNFAEETPALPTRRSKFDPYSDQMSRRVLDKKRELIKMRAERQRMLEGESGTYETMPQTEAGEVDVNLSEVPEDMRGRSLSRENNFEKQKKRRQLEFERYQPYSPQMHSEYQAGYPNDRSVPKFAPGMQTQQYAPGPHVGNPQWNPDMQGVQGYHDAQYGQRQGHPRPQGPQRRHMPGQVNFAQEDVRQYQKARRKPVNIPRN